MKTIPILASMAFMLLVQPSLASMVELWSTTKLANESDSVRIGKVSTQWSSWDPQTKSISTYIKLKVIDTVKGPSEEEILIKQPGGEVGDIGMRVHGMATFISGEKVLVFLKDRSVVGMAQGKYHVSNDPETGEEVAEFSAPPDVEFYDPIRQTLRQQVHGLNLKKKVPLKYLIEEIRNAK
ncbi:MAG: hypothetical protein KDD48_07825 [Bdellovibrionales bacterium]|nr:hypothetical protein [Bdellovibrionales bacterium]